MTTSWNDFKTKVICSEQVCEEFFQQVDTADDFFNILKYKQFLF